MAGIHIVWSPESLDDLERLHDFLHIDSPVTAKRAMSRISQGVRLLDTAPRIGRPVSRYGRLHEMVIRFGSGAYVIRYQLTDSQQAIVSRVWYSKEDRSEF